VLSHR